MLLQLLDGLGKMSFVWVLDNATLVGRSKVSDDEMRGRRHAQGIKVLNFFLTVAVMAGTTMGKTNIMIANM